MPPKNYSVKHLASFELSSEELLEHLGLKETKLLHIRYNPIYKLLEVVIEHECLPSHSFGSPVQNYPLDEIKASIHAFTTIPKTKISLMMSEFLKQNSERFTEIISDCTLHSKEIAYAGEGSKKAKTLSRK